jgi:dipeptidyl-peptidase-4
MRFGLVLALAGVSSLGAAQLPDAQQDLTQMPRYDRFQRLTAELARSIKSGAIDARWEPDATAFRFQREGKWYRFDLADRKTTESTNPDPSSGAARPRGVSRGRQSDRATSADGKWTARHVDRNIELTKPDGAKVMITQDGSAETRVKNGIASWVYGEELGVREAMWFSPDARYLAYYRFDESPVADYFLALDQVGVQSRLLVEPYPKAGTANPKVQVRIYDTQSGATRTVETGFAPAESGEYVYDIRWSPKGDALHFARANRKQNAMQLCEANPSTGVVRVLAEERQPQSWAENHPTVRFLEDGERFIWSTERNGFRNLALRDRSGREIARLTNHQADVLEVLRVDEKAGWLWYTANTGEPYMRQLHRVRLDGKGDRRLTDPALSHTVSIAPDGKHFVDVASRTDVAPTSTLRDADGKAIATVQESDLAEFRAKGYRHREVFTAPAADGRTTLYGTIDFPQDFDPARKYPVLLQVYAGPESGGISREFRPPSALAEFGFLVVNVAGRGTNGRGKAFRDAVYGKLGVVEIDDQATVVRSLGARPYVDLNRVGVTGTSYGGYAVIMLMLRYPDLFHVGVAASSVTKWENYDTIYTERYMGLPDANENAAGYAAGNAMPLAKNLKGRLMLYWGTSDDNVHPSNTYQLADALNRANRRYDMMAAPDRGHVSPPMNLMMEYMVRHLILAPTTRASAARPLPLAKRLAGR